MKQTRCSLLKNDSFWEEIMRCSTSACKTGVLSLQERPSLVCDVMVGAGYLGQVSDVEQSSGPPYLTSSCSDYSSACGSIKLVQRASEYWVNYSFL